MLHEMSIKGDASFFDFQPVLLSDFHFTKEEYRAIINSTKLMKSQEDFL